MATLVQRLSAALKAFRAPRAALVLPAWQRGQPYYELQTFENYVTHGYRKNELIFACIEAHQLTAASVSYRVYDRRSGEELPDHPLRRLLERPNPFMSEYEFLWLVTGFLKLAGKAYFEKVYDHHSGELVALWPMRPDFVEIMPDDKRFIGAYRYTVPGVAQIDMPPEQVLAIRNMDPLDPYRSFAPVQVAARVGDVDNHITDYIKLFFERGAMPSGILKIDKVLTDAEVAGLRRRWAERYGGFNRWFEPAVLDQQADYQRIELSFAEMQFEVLDDRDEARICAVLRVPPIIAGARIGLKFGTYSNYEEARRMWWQDVLKPQYEMISNALTRDLARVYGDEVEIRADLSGVPALQESETHRWERAERGLSAGFMTVNEVREYLGLSNIGAAGDVFLRSFGVQPVDTDGQPAGIPEMEAHAAARLERLTDLSPGEVEAAREELKAQYGFVLPDPTVVERDYA